jgi:hypothetical protein
VLLDWGDSGVGHPLLDQAAFLDRIPAGDVEPVRVHWNEDVAAPSAGLRSGARSVAAGAGRRGAAGADLPRVPRRDRALGARVPRVRPCRLALAHSRAGTGTVRDGLTRGQSGNAGGKWAGAAESVGPRGQPERHPARVSPWSGRLDAERAVPARTRTSGSTPRGRAGTSRAARARSRDRSWLASMRCRHPDAACPAAPRPARSSRCVGPVRHRHPRDHLRSRARAPPPRHQA